MQRARVVIVGAGFAGLEAARSLRSAPADITLIDRRNHHTFQPLLYQVASAALSPADIAAPIRRIFKDQSNCRVVMADVRAIDCDARTVTAGAMTFGYDYLIVATGATHSYFGNDAWAARAPGLKTVEDALDIRRRVLHAFERAENATDEAERREALTFAIIGAGPTGVEMAGALAEIATSVVRSDYRTIDTASRRVVLIEGLDRVLPSFDQECSASAQRQLASLGVECRLGKLVTDIDAGGLTIGEGPDADRLEAGTIIWAAGVKASPLGRMLGAATDKTGRVEVEPDLSVPGRPEVFVLGDLAKVVQKETKGSGTEVPGVAPAAMQMGRHTGRTVADLIEGEANARRAFRYVDKGLLATIGRHRATGTVFGKHVHGFIAWALWAWVHLFFLIGFRNRAVVMLQWAWSYVTHHRGARLITEVPGCPGEEQPGGGS